MQYFNTRISLISLFQQTFIIYHIYSNLSNIRPNSVPAKWELWELDPESFAFLFFLSLTFTSFITFCLARLGPTLEIKFDFFNSVSSVFSSFLITLLKSCKVSAQHCLKKINANWIWIKKRELIRGLYDEYWICTADFLHRIPKSSDILLDNTNKTEFK